MSEQLKDKSLHQATVRSQLYRCFALAFSHPGEDFLNSLLSGEFSDLLIQLGEQLPYSFPFGEVEMNALKGKMNKQEIKIFYSTFFESGNHAVSLRELAYSTVTEKALLEELFRFYQHFGLEFSQGELRELPDNLPIELEFLHYLTFLEAKASSAGEENVNIQALRTAQRDFVVLHPGRWIELFLVRLKTVADNTVYASLAELLLQFISREKHFLSGSGDNLIATG